MTRHKGGEHALQGPQNTVRTRAIDSRTLYKCQSAPTTEHVWLHTPHHHSKSENLTFSCHLRVREQLPSYFKRGSPIIIFVARSEQTRAGEEHKYFMHDFGGIVVECCTETFCGTKSFRGQFLERSSALTLFHTCFHPILPFMKPNR